MSLVKLPFILVATLGLHYTFTPPNVAMKDERIHMTSLGLWVYIVGLFTIPFKVYLIIEARRPCL